MRGYVLPIVLALLLAAPMLWRLEGGLDQKPGAAPIAWVTFHDSFPDDPAGRTLTSARQEDGDARFGFLAQPSDSGDGDVRAAVLPASLLQAEIED